MREPHKKGQWKVCKTCKKKFLRDAKHSITQWTMKLFCSHVCSNFRYRTHMLSKTVEYTTWTRMIDRCENPNNKRWDRYGGRGIKVCRRWRINFQTFLADVGHRPSNKHSIERRDNDGNYSPANCYWATQKEQARNTCRNRQVLLNGRTMCLSEAAELSGVNISTAKGRLIRGMSDDEAFLRKDRRKVTEFEMWKRE